MSTVFRIEKKNNYTVMSNHHLRNCELSLKAKGLFSVILSLPDGWDYTLGGLAAISKESLDAIRSAINELEKFGYLHREQTRNSLGRLSNNEYFVYECPEDNPYFNSETAENADTVNLDEVPKNRTTKPFSPSLENPTTVKNTSDLPLSENPITVNPITENPLSGNPLSGKPSTEKPLSENPTQLNKDKSNKDLLSKDLINQSNQSNPPMDRIDVTDSSNPNFSFFGSEKEDFERAKYLKQIHDNIEYDFVRKLDKPQVDELVNIMLDVICSKGGTVRVNGGEVSRQTVKERFLSLDLEHIEYVLDSIKRGATEIHNPRAYLMTALFNAPVTIQNHISAEMQANGYI